MKLPAKNRSDACRCMQTVLEFIFQRQFINSNKYEIYTAVHMCPLTSQWSMLYVHDGNIINQKKTTSINERVYKHHKV